MRWAGHVEHIGEERRCIGSCRGKPEGRRPLGRPRRRWVDNITMDLQEVRCGYMDWTGLAQDRDRWRTLVSAVMNIRVPWNAGNFLTSCKPVNFSRTLHNGVSNSVFYSLQLINTRSCNYSCTSSCWWVSTPETCRAAYRNVINWIIGILLDDYYIRF